MRLTARHHRHGVLESVLRPAVARMNPSVHALLEGGSVRVGGDVGTGVVRHGRGHSYADRADDPDAFVAALFA